MFANGSSQEKEGVDDEKNKGFPYPYQVFHGRGRGFGGFHDLFLRAGKRKGPQRIPSRI